MLHPKTLFSLKYSRLVMLVKDGLNLQVIDELMDNEVSSVWVKVNKRGARNLLLGGIYTLNCTSQAL